jgi:lysophospholipase L1-like esterase
MIGRKLLTATLPLLLLGMVFAGAAPAAAAPVTGTDRNGSYLALGDSVAFGYVPPDAVPAPDYYDARSFVGYPEDIARALGLRVSNASCPGETTSSMLDVTAQSNGCENSVGSPVGYRTLYPLHVEYRGSQIAYAESYLTHHRRTRLVTIDIGANDAFVCQATTADVCSSTAELDALAGEIAGNLAAIYAGIRSVYGGPLVALTYYSLSYTDPTQIAAAVFLNSVIAGAGAKYGVIVADGFKAFEEPSLAAGGSPCAAGLLIPVPGGTCNIHPSAYGHWLLARAVEAVLPSADHDRS